MYIGYQARNCLQPIKTFPPGFSMPLVSKTVLKSDCRPLWQRRVSYVNEERSATDLARQSSRTPFSLPRNDSLTYVRSEFFVRPMNVADSPVGAPERIRKSRPGRTDVENPTSRRDQLPIIEPGTSMKHLDIIVLSGRIDSCDCITFHWRGWIAGAR